MALGSHNAMSEDWFMQLMNDPWFIAIASFCLGLLTCWVIKVVREEHAEEVLVDADGNLVKSRLTKQQHKKLAALATEIENAQKMLSENEAEVSAYTELLSELDEAVKRSNGRLKLMVKAIKHQK